MLKQRNVFMRKHISEIAGMVGKSVELKGWVHRKRTSGKIIFIVLRDHTGIVQASFKSENLPEKEWEAAENVAVESSIAIEGKVVSDPRAPTGYEISGSSIKLISASEPYPITEYQSTELLLDKRHLWLRSTRMTKIMKVRSAVFRHTRSFLDRNGFFEITPPLITASAGESGADMFTVDYFGKDVYLTESSQLYSEAMIYSLEKVYSFAPSFRAEKSRTTKHLAEYWHLEPEMAYFDLNMTMELIENLISSIASGLIENEGELLEQLVIDKKTLSVVKPPFKRITYEKAIELLNKKGKELSWGDDLGVDEERMLTQDEKVPVFVTHWPKEIKPFYMPINPEDDRTVLCADLQAPAGHGEIVGGSERVWKYEDAIRRFREVEAIKGVKFNMDNYAWYLDLMRYGGVPHAGFGMGMERLIKWMLNLDHIRDAIPFPRMSNRVSP